MTKTHSVNLSNEDNLISKTTSNGRQPQNIKVEYLSNHLLDDTQILNLSLDDQTIFYKSIQWRRAPMEDDFKKLKVKYLSNHLLDHTPILNRMPTKILWLANPSRFVILILLLMSSQKNNACFLNIEIIEYNCFLELHRVHEIFKRLFFTSIPVMSSVYFS